MLNVSCCLIVFAIFMAVYFCHCIFLLFESLPFLLLLEIVVKFLGFRCLLLAIKEK